MPYYDNQKKKWIGQIRIKGKKYKSVHLSKTKAKQWEVVKRKEMEILSFQINTISLHEYATKYLDYSKQTHSEKTYKEKCTAFRLFFKSVSPSLPVEQLHKGVVLSHLQEQAKKRSGHAANKDRKNFIASWNWGIKYIEKFPGQNPFLVDRFPEIRKPRYVPSEQDFWKVYRCAESDMDGVMLLAYLHLAARRNEIFYLRCSDIDLKSKQIRLYTRKRKDGTLEFDWLPLTEKLFCSLKKIIEQKLSKWVFPNPETQVPYIARSKWLPRLCKKAKVKQFGIHSIRHLSASILSSNNVPMIDIQTILRHKNLSTTERYIHRLKSVRSALSHFK